MFGVGSGLPPSNKTLVFVQNHDTERNGDALSYKDGATNTLANEFLLAYGYGRPQVYSSFTWNISDDSPPSDADGMITDTDCASTAWACVDRNQGVVGHGRLAQPGRQRPAEELVGRRAEPHRRSAAAAAAGSRLNNDPAAHTSTFRTGLAKGTYCDVIHRQPDHGSCSGPTVTVDGHGRATVTVPAKDAVAFTVADLVHR